VARDDSEVLAALRAVQEPDLLRGLGELGMLRDVELGRRKLSVKLALPVAQWPCREELAARVRTALESIDGLSDATLEMVAMTDEERAELIHRLASRPGGEPPDLPRGATEVSGGGTEEVPAARPRTAAGGPGGPPTALVARPGSPNRYLSPGSRTRIVGVSSGKGGVGKSSVTVNLALALAGRGHEVGLLDADVYGFSVPKMMGVDREPVALDGLLVPPVVHGVRCMSMGFFVSEEQPVIWRGPMLHKTLEQFLVDAYWGEPDFLLIDMPPGTGDVALSIGQYLPRTEVVVVTTPQPAAQRVAQRSAFAAKRLKLSVRGVIENMSWFTGDDGKRYELFGSGGGRLLATSLEVPLLAQVPLVPAVRKGADEGIPVKVYEPGGEAANAFDALADAIVELGPARIYRSALTVR
jgi:ATP-binding protein involved in chromosome partitioning